MEIPFFKVALISCYFNIFCLIAVFLANLQYYVEQQARMQLFHWL